MYIHKGKCEKITHIMNTKRNTLGTIKENEGIKYQNTHVLFNIIPQFKICVVGDSL